MAVGVDDIASPMMKTILANSAVGNENEVPVDALAAENRSQRIVGLLFGIALEENFSR